MLAFPPPIPYEHKYSLGETDIYACEPQAYVGNTYIKGEGKLKMADQTAVSKTYIKGGEK